MNPRLCLLWLALFILVCFGCSDQATTPATKPLFPTAYWASTGTRGGLALVRPNEKQELVLSWPLQGSQVNIMSVCQVQSKTFVSGYWKNPSNDFKGDNLLLAVDSDRFTTERVTTPFRLQLKANLGSDGSKLIAMGVPANEVTQIGLLSTEDLTWEVLEVEGSFDQVIIIPGSAIWLATSGKELRWGFERSGKIELESESASDGKVRIIGQGDDCVYVELNGAISKIMVSEGRVKREQILSAGVIHFGLSVVGVVEDNSSLWIATTDGYNNEVVWSPIQDGRALRKQSLKLPHTARAIAPIQPK